jgi:hypothetical protein
MAERLFLQHSLRDCVEVGFRAADAHALALESLGRLRELVGVLYLNHLVASVKARRNVKGVKREIRLDVKSFSS